MSEKRCYTVQELQEILGVSRPTIYNLLKKKEFRWVQLVGGKYRISKKSFDDWLDNLDDRAGNGKAAGIKKGTPSDVIAFMWEYMKVPENSREKVKNLIKDVHENDVKLDYKAPKLYDVIQKEEIADFEEVMRKTIADIVSEASGVACWVYVQKYVKQKTLDEMLQELPGAGQFIIVMNTWFERLMNS